MKPSQRTRRVRPWAAWGAGIICIAGVATAALVNTTMQDFHLAGTQVFDVPSGIIMSSPDCMLCHGPLGQGTDPYASWHGSLMAQAGRDPLFYAQMANANQDAANVGYYCMRCHVPLSFVSGGALVPDGSALYDYDFDGINCHFCHSMVDPIYKPGVSPPEDEAILNALASTPEFYGNAMFVLDPEGRRRGSRPNPDAMHEFLHSPFHATGDFCGTCHDVGNVAITRQPDGTYQYNALNQPPPNEDPHSQFPLERTYTEWKLSAFANGGVDMGGRFGGTMGPVVSTCQHCHMPRVSGQACWFGPEYPDLATHDFAGASAWVLEIIGIHYANDPEVDPVALQAGQAKAVDMLQRAASLEVQQQCDALRVRVINETGHKLPTGHIEGRRVWLNVKMFDTAQNLVAEYGHYDYEEAHLDEPSTKIYEMQVGLSEYAANLLNLPPGVTTRMSLADTIVKDNRIPPRGFNNAAYEAGGAPAVGAVYADGQYWDDTNFNIPATATSAVVTVNYQTVTRHYIEALRDGNVSNNWGNILYDLWLQTDKGPPIPMVIQEITLAPSRPADVSCDGVVNVVDLLAVINNWGPLKGGPGSHRVDINQDGVVNVTDLLQVIANWG